MLRERRIEKSNHWTLDKRIQLPLIFFLIGQLAIGIWVAAGIVSKVENHDKRMEVLEAGRSEIRDISYKLIRLEVLIENMTDKVDKIDRKPRK